MTQLIQGPGTSGQDIFGYGLKVGWALCGWSRVFPACVLCVSCADFTIIN